MCIGKTSAYLLRHGNNRSINDILTIETNGYINNSENLISRFVEIVWGQQAFNGFILFIICKISMGVQGWRNMVLLFKSSKDEEKLFLDLRFFHSPEDPIFTKNSFKYSGISVLELNTHFVTMMTFNYPAIQNKKFFTFATITV